VAITTKVAARIHSWRATSAPGSMNCGRKATKNTMPFGFSAVTSQVFANSRQRERGAAGASAAVDEMPARSSRTPR